MNDLDRTTDGLAAHVDRMVPRILSQACRDPNAPAYGAFDRDWWHYRIRDFPSIILQQGGYAAWLAGGLKSWAPGQAGLTALAAASARFWNRRAVRHGAFEEYYPWEHAYPPAAFSTLAVMKLAAAGVVPSDSVRAGAVVAARQLLRRFEPEAANQQVAGLAALAWLRKVFPDLAPEPAFAKVAARTLALQSDEGWFMEYGGPDLAYLSVALDALWDLLDATGDQRYRDAIERAVACMAEYVPLMRASIGMHNARNTDYILPYGLVRCLAAGGPSQALAAALLPMLYGNVQSPDHFLHAIDDRYHCHYSGHSLIRATRLLRELQAGGRWPDPGPLADTAVERLLPGCGHYLRRRPATDGVSVLLSLRKGGVLTALRGADRVSDFGWVVTVGTTQHVSHWWSPDWSWTREPDGFTVKGRLTPHRELVSTPAKHAVLRLLSLVLGSGLIPALKAQLIFKKRPSPYGFERRIVLEDARIRIADRITGLPAGAQIESAPRASKRHVSSADAFHGEDLRLCVGPVCERTTQCEGGVFRAETVYSFT